MQSIHHFSRILTNLNNVNAEIASLGVLFSEGEAITDIDKGFIDSFNASANAMVAAATALKEVTYTPPTEEAKGE